MKYSPTLQGFHLLLTALGHSGLTAFINARVCSSEGKRTPLYLQLPTSPRQANLEAAKTQMTVKNKDPCLRLTRVLVLRSRPNHDSSLLLIPLSQTDTSGQTNVLQGSKNTFFCFCLKQSLERVKTHTHLSVDIIGLRYRFNTLYDLSTHRRCVISPGDLYRCNRDTYF